MPEWNAFYSEPSEVRSLIYNCNMVIFLCCLLRGKTFFLLNELHIKDFIELPQIFFDEIFVTAVWFDFKSKIRKCKPNLKLNI